MAAETLPDTAETYSMLDALVDADPIRLRDVAWEQVRTNATAEDRGYQRAVAELRDSLAHHLNASDDPCQDRGIDSPCDVADALAAAAPEGGGS